MRRCTEGFRKLIAWREAKALALKIYIITKQFPSSERYRLTDQLCRAVGSAMSNLAEGSAMPTVDHRNAYYYRSRGSVTEVDNHMELAYELQYVTQAEQEDIADHCARLTYLITRLIKS